MTEDAEPADGPTKDSEQASTIIGNAVAVIETKPMTALLTPAFTHLGKYLGEEVGERIARQKRRKSLNVKGHVDKVNARIEPTFDDLGPTERQEEAVEDWVAGAERVSPEREAELAALWQGLLEAIYADDDEMMAMQEALAGLATSDARLLLQIDQGWTHIDDEERANKLASLGLLRTPRPRDVIGTTAIAYAGTGLSGLVLVIAAPALAQALYYNLEAVDRFTEVFRVTGWLVLVLGFVFLAARPVRLAGSMRLTALGGKLQAMGKKYLSATKS